MEKKKLYYDGECQLCSAVAERIGNDDMERIDIHSGSLPPGATLDQSMRDVHLVDADGKIYKGSEAVLKILEGYRFLGWLARVGHLPGIKQLSAGLYRLIAAHRYLLGIRKRR